MAGRTPKTGEVLGGKYRVERVIGSGGMGVVVAARHVDLGQRVAVKLMLEEALVDPAHAERFAREARAAVQLKSLHTARVLDVGKTKSGEPFMVMEYLEGHDLDEVVKRGPLPPHIAVDYVLQACEAFAEAHALAMVHRDIKLKNLFLTSTVDGRALVKVLDFGLAKKIGISGGDVSLTATSAVFGSPQYMSPEQMRSAKDVDARSDIWSIGVCVYELLTGRLPFDANGVAEICAMVLKDPVTPPSRWAPGIPPDLEAVVLRCLEKDPALRYQSVADLAFALEPYSAVEGSANRILHVIESARHNAIPTSIQVDAGPVVEGARTLAAWGSGASLGGKRTPIVALAAIATVMFLAVAFGAGAAWRHHAAKTDEAAATSGFPPPVETLPPAAETAAATATPIATAVTAGASTAGATATATSLAALPGAAATDTSAPATTARPKTAVPRATGAARAPTAPTTATATAKTAATATARPPKGPSDPGDHM